jgi:coproporphyrinogen III oxidase-like Fe-S oxidoreductase
MNAPVTAGYDRPVPRYTSYPTAAQFETGVGPVQHRAWLADLDETSAALYLHVPFCKQLCWYCACHTAAVNRPESLEAYARAVAAGSSSARSNGAGGRPRCSVRRGWWRSPNAWRSVSTG